MNSMKKRCWTREERVRWGIRGHDAFTAEELAQLQREVEGWILPAGSPSWPSPASDAIRQEAQAVEPP